VISANLIGACCSLDDPPPAAVAAATAAAVAVVVLVLPPCCGCCPIPITDLTLSPIDNRGAAFDEVEGPAAEGGDDDEENGSLRLLGDLICMTLLEDITTGVVVGGSLEVGC
jgi:hypothetical protein